MHEHVRSLKRGSTSPHSKLRWKPLWTLLRDIPTVASVFTGLIEEVGRTLWIRATDHGTELQIAAPQLANEASIGDSIAVNGCCLTVRAHRPGHLTFDLLNETLERTNLKTLRRDGPVNLERALPANGRLGGHFVQGHVDCTSEIVSFEQNGDDHRLEVGRRKNGIHS